MSKQNLFLLILLTVLLVTRLPFLGSGLSVIEPDEEDYRQIAQSAANGWPLFWEGKPFFYKFPLFIYLGYFIGKLFPFIFALGPYLNLRLIAVISFIGLTYLFYKYIGKKLDRTTALWSTLFLILTPITLFYSRQGTFETFYLFFGFWFFKKFSEEKDRLDNNKVLILGGLLGLAILTKHINILLISFPMFYLIKGLIILKRKRFKKILPFTVIIVLALSLVGFTLLPVYIYSKPLITEQFIGSPRQFFIGHSRAFLGTFWEYMKISPYWLSWPIFLGSIAGVWLSLKKWRNNIDYLLVLGIGLIYINSYAITPRSYVFIVPYLIIGLAFLIQLLKDKSWGKLFLTLLIIITAIQSKTAFDSTRHSGVEQLLNNLKDEYVHEELPVYATFEEDKLSVMAGLPINIVTWEATKSGYILTDQRKTELMLSLSEPEWIEARRIYEWLKANQTPIWVFNDPWPHFPGTDKGNKFRIYKLTD